ncbi:MAG: hypothetical protein M5U28_39105 [Sandaracinaceae bacterium]|nr:hypothetical protein [Sandaracinaceae bacterium]
MRLGYTAAPRKERAMSSISQKTEKRRRIRKRAVGKKQKAERARQGTPPFAVNPEKAGPDSAEKRG